VRIYYKGYLKGAFTTAPQNAKITKNQALGTPTPAVKDAGVFYLKYFLKRRIFQIYVVYIKKQIIYIF